MVSEVQSLYQSTTLVLHVVKGVVLDVINWALIRDAA